MKVTLYELLQIDSAASADEINQAFSRLMHQYPWAQEGECGRMIRAAHGLLATPEARRIYDRLLAGNRY